MSDKPELFLWLDAEILSGVPAIDYAQEHIEEIISSAYEKCTRKVYTSNGYDLGIVCPSLVNHRVIGGHKRGRILKSIPVNANYCEIGFDAEDEPLYFKMINIFGTETTYYFFHFDGFIWAMNMSLPARVWHDKIKKFRYDAQGRIAYYAEMTSPYSGETPDFGCSITNVYEYPETPEEPIICHFYYYVTRVCIHPELLKNVDAQFSEHRYEITPDLKSITEYRITKDGESVFSRKIESSGKKASKPKISADSYPKFAEWLDGELEREYPDSAGIYFDLFGPNEDGFGMYFCVTKGFDAEDDDWACEVEYTSENMHMIATTGQMEWEDALAAATRLIKKYLREGKYKSILRRYDGIGTSFPDGDIAYVFVKKK